MLLRTALLLSILAGCGGEPRVVATRRAPTQRGALAASELRAADGVVAMESACASGAAEACDALDSDCDGRIDEGCAGAGEGDLTVAVAWNDGADVDLVLGVPEDRVARTASRADCADEPRLERATVREPEAGAFRIALRHAAACGTEGPVTATVSVAFGGRVLGIYNRAIEPGREADVVSFELR
jgi:putative metal-binding protein